MALIEHRSRIAIADQFDSAEHAPTHGLVDLAAALASDAWDATPLAKATGPLYDALTAALPFE